MDRIFLLLFMSVNELTKVVPSHKNNLISSRGFQIIFQLFQLQLFLDR